ncbi:relaxase/mobilization nuclease domain-containing protein [Sphingobacterium sp. NPDC055431]
MVAVIKTGSSIRRIFLYNENKIELGVARCLSAINYPMDAHQMSSSMRLNRLLQQAALNSKVMRNSVHISLNFDPTEKDLSDDRLIEIAKRYMEGIGFSDQPFLIYRHFDAAHPHIHLVSIKVRSDGSRIDMHNMGRNQSEKIRSLIEREFNLVKAGQSTLKLSHIPKGIDLAKVHYGRSETRAAIQHVLEEVLNSYSFSNLHQLNAILRQFNVLADRGSERSRIYTNKGLLYGLMDEHGNKVGVPIKASDLYSRPTLKNLQGRFEQKQPFRNQHKIRTIYSIDKAIQGQIKDIEEFKGRLLRQAIDVVIRESASGVVYGITYVDHKNKCVFNGSELGKQYSAKAILARLADPVLEENSIKIQDRPFVRLNIVPARSEPNKVNGSTGISMNILSIAKNPLETLFNAPNSADYIPHAFKKRKKKKKRKIQY